MRSPCLIGLAVAESPTGPFAHISDPGVFSADAFDDTSYGSGVAWGLSQLYDENKQLINQLGRPRFSSYVVRWDCDMRAPAASPSAFRR